jgi:hypothetical protein
VESSFVNSIGLLPVAQWRSTSLLSWGIQVRVLSGRPLSKRRVMNTFVLFVCYMLFVLLMVIRAVIIHRNAIKAIRITGVISLGYSRVQGDWEHPWKIFDSYPPSYVLILDIRKWTFDQCYPGIKNNTLGLVL